ncbi:MAG: acyl-CoA dehydrogenase family protein [Aquincola tertiaricarbonis]
MNQPDIDGDATAGLRLAMREALRSAPVVARGDPFPRAWWQHLGARSMLGVGFDPDGREPRADWPAVAALAGIIAHETAQLGLALGWLMNEMLGRFVICPHVRHDSHRALLRRMAAGRKIVALAISEPQAGAHPKLLRCAARRHDGQWLLEGEKAFVSNGPAADSFVVLAVTGEDAGRKRFDAFIVDADNPGMARRPTGRDAVLLPLGHCGLVLDGCLVPDARRLSTDGKAFDLIAKPLRTLEDTLLGSAMAGAMLAELEALARWQRGTRPTPDTLRRLGALRLELMAIDTLVAQSSRQLDRQGPGEQQADLNAGLRILLQRWQAGCEAFAAQLDDHETRLLDIAGDLRIVLGIARGVGEARHLKAGTGLVSTKENHEIPA